MISTDKNRVIRRDSGPAYPATRNESLDGACGFSSVAEVNYPGMSLRDFFAGQVLASANGIPMSSDCQRRAELAYEQADAMLKEREK